MNHSIISNTESIINSSVLAVFAHPDDETFRCGGTFALLANRGVPIHILTFTRGQAGSCGNPPICSQGDLSSVRTKELICACQSLGVETPNILDYEDGKLININQEEGIAEIIIHIKKYRPQIVITWPPDGLSGHPDHIAVSRWVFKAFQQLINEGNEELKSLYHLAMPESLAQDLGMKNLHTIADNKVTITINVQSVWKEKMAAISCHKTQLGESPILQASIEKQTRFLGYEHFHQAYSSHSQDVLLNLSLDLKEA